jgi:hypothetical protein
MGVSGWWGPAGLGLTKCDCACMHLCAAAALLCPSRAGTALQPAAAAVVVCKMVVSKMGAKCSAHDICGPAVHACQRLIGWVHILNAPLSRGLTTTTVIVAVIANRHSGIHTTASLVLQANCEVTAACKKHMTLPDGQTLVAPAASGTPSPRSLAQQRYCACGLPAALTAQQQPSQQQPLHPAACTIRTVILQ